MAYTPKHKVGDKVTLTGEIKAVVDFRADVGKEPMYLISMSGSWFWAWAEVADGAKPGDPDPPPWPPGG